MTGDFIFVTGAGGAIGRIVTRTLLMRGHRVRGFGLGEQFYRSPEFFDVARFPRATFASTEVRLPDGGNPVIRGRLRLHGAERAADPAACGRTPEPSAPQSMVGRGRCNTRGDPRWSLP